MTKADIVKQIAAKTGVQHQQAQEVVQLTFDHIVEALVRDGRIELRDFGVFETRLAPPRIARNPKTGAEVSLPERRRVRFRAGQLLAQRVNVDNNSPAPRDRN